MVARRLLPVRRPVVARAIEVRDQAPKTLHLGPASEVEVGSSSTAQSHGTDARCKHKLGMWAVAHAPEPPPGIGAAAGPAKRHARG
jgi:hypothetical protein